MRVHTKGEMLSSAVANELRSYEFYFRTHIMR